MVKVAITGANSGLALEIIDELVKDQKHEVVALCRKDLSAFPQQPGVQWAQTTFKDKAELVRLFSGVEVVLNFIVVSSDPGNVSSNNVLAAAVEAGVKRYAPSEWAMSQKLHDIISVVPWYQGKLDIQAKLRNLNRHKKVIDYCFFQPGMFMEFVGYPRRFTKYVTPMPTIWQLEDLHVVAVKGHEDDPVTMTTIGDVVSVVRHAIEYEGEWPEVGGIAGQQISALQFKELVENITGKPVQLDLVDESDLRAGALTVKMPQLQHPSVPADQWEAFSTPGWIGVFLSVANGAWTVTEEWNKLLPDYKFTSTEEFIKRTWSSM